MYSITMHYTAGRSWRNNDMVKLFILYTFQLYRKNFGFNKIPTVFTGSAVHAVLQGQSKKKSSKNHDTVIAFTHSSQS